MYYIIVYIYICIMSVSVQICGGALYQDDWTCLSWAQAGGGCGLPSLAGLEGFAAPSPPEAGPPRPGQATPGQQPTWMVCIYIYI